MKRMRTGALFSDGSLMVMMPRDKVDEVDEALDLIEGANRGQMDKAKLAKLVDVDLDHSKIRERL